MPRILVRCALAGFALTAPVTAAAQIPPPADLSGAWMDAGRPVTIVQAGSTVTATFDEPPLCDPQDGSEPQPRETDFTGTLNGRRIEGETTVCNYGEEWGSEIGIQMTDMWLVPSADGTELAGEYDGMDGWTEFSLTRSGCDPALWEDYQRKEAVARELMAHSGDLMRAGTAEAQETWREFLQSVAVETVSGELNGAAVRRSERHYLGELDKIFEDVSVLSESQRRMASRGYRGVGAFKKASGIGTLAFISEQLYRMADTVRRVEAKSAEAREAQARAVELLEQALEDFRVALSQVEECARLEDEVREAEERLERAKALRDEWDLGTGLYRDAAGGIYDAAGALERAKEILSEMDETASEAVVEEAAGRAAAEIRTAIGHFELGMDRFADRLDREPAYLRALERLLEDAAPSEAPPVG